MSGLPKPIASVVPDGHRSAERRSLAMHQEIAASLTEAGVQRARERVRAWAADGSVDPHWVAAWQAVLDGSVPEVVRDIATDDPRMTQLRQSTPFAGSLSNAARWRILREVR